LPAGWGESFSSSNSSSLVVAAFDNWIMQVAVGKDPTDKNLMPGIDRGNLFQWQL